MLENPIKREGVKVVGAIAAGVVGGPVLVSLAAVLGIAVEALGHLGEKRTKELFYEDTEYAYRIVAAINASDDFASFVYDVWMKHNLESSKQRRQQLRGFLRNVVGSDDKKFQNFTRIINLIQEISNFELRVVDSFYSDRAHAFSQFQNDNKDEYRLNTTQILSLLDDNIDQHELIATLNQLGHYGLIGVSYNVMNGPYYWPVPFGRTFLEYINHDTEEF